MIQVKCIFNLQINVRVPQWLVSGACDKYLGHSAKMASEHFLIKGRVFSITFFSAPQIGYSLQFPIYSLLATDIFYLLRKGKIFFLS